MKCSQKIDDRVDESWNEHVKVTCVIFSSHPEMGDLPDIGVVRKIESSEYTHMPVVKFFVRLQPSPIGCAGTSDLDPYFIGLNRHSWQRAALRSFFPLRPIPAATDGHRCPPTASRKPPGRGC